MRIDSGDGERQRERRDRHGRPRDPNKLTLREGLRSLAHRNRRQLYPWLAMLTVASAGLAASFVGWLSGADALTGQVTTAICAVGVGVLVIALITKRIPAYWASWLTVCAADGAAWISTTAAYGFDYPKLVWLYGSTALLALRWWRHVRHPHAADPASVVDSNAGAHLAQDWADNAACLGGPAPGTRLTGLMPYEHGYTGDVLLVRGRQSLADIQSALPRLSTALDVAQERLIIEAHPQGPPSRLRVQIVTRSPIKTAVYFDRPVYRNGRILLGPYADGLDDASFVLYSEDSMECGYVLGSKGSGKSRVLETVALSALACTPTVIFYVDGQNGASSPLLWDHALWRCGPDKADTVLRALLGIKDFRQLYNRRFRLPGFTPSAQMPGILVVVDECHRIFAENTKEWADLAREGRKLGIGILAASQVTTLDAFGGSLHADALRSSLVSSNGIALRTASRVQSTVFPGLSVDLMSLPKLPGFGYTVDDGDDQHRTAPFRNRWLIGAGQAAKRSEPLPDGVRTAEEWFAEIAPRQVLDERSAHAAGPAFLNRHEIAERERAELERLFDTQPGNDTSDPMADTLAPAERLAADTDLTATVLPFPSLPKLPQFTPDAPAQPDGELPKVPEGITDAQYAVWDTIAHDIHSTAEIAIALALTQRRIQVVVSELVAAGHLVKTGRGTYAITRRQEGPAGPTHAQTDAKREAFGHITAATAAFDDAARLR